MYKSKVPKIPVVESIKRLIRRSVLLTALLPAISLPRETGVPDSLLEAARRLHYTLLTIDTHEDSPSRLPKYDMGVRHVFGTPRSGSVDLPRMKEGGLAASFFAVFQGQGPLTQEGREKAKNGALHTLDMLDKMFQSNKELCERALTTADARRIFKTGRRAIFIGMENGYSVGLDLSNVDLFFKRGVRYITLVHGSNNDLCSSSTDSKDGTDRGLSELGKRVVGRMNDLGIIVDVSHISEKSFYDVLKITRAPVMASHSCARALRDHPRNLTDKQLQALKANGGVIQIAFMGDYLKKIEPVLERVKEEAGVRRRVEAKGGWRALSDEEADAFWSELEAIRAKYPGSEASVADLADHIDHVVKTIGIDYVGIGTDFDGGGSLRDCRDVTEMPNVTIELMRRGYKPDDIRKIWGENLLRVLKRVEEAAGGR